MTFSLKHQCVFSLLPSSTTAVATLDVLYIQAVVKAVNRELLRVSLQGTKNRQFQLPFFRLNQNFGNFSIALSSSALSV